MAVGILCPTMQSGRSRGLQSSTVPMDEQATLNLPAHNAADRWKYDIYEPCCLKWLKTFVHFEHCRIFCSHWTVASAPLEGHYDSSQCRIGSFTDFSLSQQLCCLQQRIFGHSAPFEPLFRALAAYHNPRFERGGIEVHCLNPWSWRIFCSASPAIAAGIGTSNRASITF